MKVLITGASSFTGYWFASALAEAGHHVVAPLRGPISGGGEAIRDEILRFLGYRVRTAAASGRPPGPESSVMKLAVSARYEVGGDLMLDIEGAAGALMGDDAPYGGRFQDLFMGQWAPRIGGGTDQVQRNIIGERVLGLPGDIRVDKDVAFRDLPRA